MSIVEKIKKIKNEIPENVKLVAVSKTKSNQEIMEAYNGGHRVFGENRIQELTQKHEDLPKDIKWHMIGHLQSNKVKYIAGFIDLIHAVDSLKLLKEIQKQAEKQQRNISCLLQFCIAKEESKFGLSLNDAVAILESDDYQNLTHVRIAGVMGMGTFTYNKSQTQAEFRALKEIYTKLKAKYFAKDKHFKEISMGMSGDYKIAIDEGSTMLRLGSSIFGNKSAY